MSEAAPICETRAGEETINGRTIQEQALESQTIGQIPSSDDPQIQEWETRARAWLSTLPKRRNVMMSDMEAWIDSPQVYLPDELKSLPRSQLYQRLLSIHKLMRRPNQVRRPLAFRFRSFSVPLFVLSVSTLGLG